MGNTGGEEAQAHYQAPVKTYLFSLKAAPLLIIKNIPCDYSWISTNSTHIESSEIPRRSSHRVLFGGLPLYYCKVDLLIKTIITSETIKDVSALSYIT